MSDTHTPATRDYYAIRYTDAAPDGLPPVIQADQTIRYRDQAGTWVAALWNAPTADTPSNCILRVDERHVESVSRHPTLADAASHLGAPTAPPPS